MGRGGKREGEGEEDEEEEREGLRERQERFFPGWGRNTKDRTMDTVAGKLIEILCSGSAYGVRAICTNKQGGLQEL